MPPPTLLLDCTDLWQAHGRGSQAPRQSDTPRNMEPHLASPWAAQAASRGLNGQAGEELGVQRAHESAPLPQTRWEAAGDWRTGLHSTQPGRKEGGGTDITGRWKPYGQKYLYFITSVNAVCTQYTRHVQYWKWAHAEWVPSLKLALMNGLTFSSAHSQQTINPWLPDCFNQTVPFHYNPCWNLIC